MTLVFSRPGGLLLALLLGLAGCGQKEETGTVAVLDLQRAMSESGLAAEVEKGVNVAREQGKAQLANLKAQLEAELTKSYAALGPDASDDDKAGYERKHQAANQNYSLSQKKVEQNIANLQNRLTGEARAKIHKATTKLAAERDFKVVFLRGSAFDYDPEVDVTDSVLARLRQTSLESTE
jgi:Skp family chaperone for outer membrane proteins